MKKRQIPLGAVERCRLFLQQFINLLCKVKAMFRRYSALIVDKAVIFIKYHGYRCN